MHSGEGSYRDVVLEAAVWKVCVGIARRACASDEVPSKIGGRIRPVWSLHLQCGSTYNAVSLNRPRSRWYRVNPCQRCGIVRATQYHRSREGGGRKPRAAISARGCEDKIIVGVRSKGSACSWRPPNARGPKGSRKIYIETACGVRFQGSFWAVGCRGSHSESRERISVHSCKRHPDRVAGLERAEAAIGQIVGLNISFSRLIAIREQIQTESILRIERSNEVAASIYRQVPGCTWRTFHAC